MAGARLGVRRGRWRFAGSAEAGVRAVFADGETDMGATGDRVSAVPVVNAGVHTLWAPGDRVQPSWMLRAGAGVELSLIRKSFEVNQVEILDLGRARPILELAVVFFVP